MFIQDSASRIMSSGHPPGLVYLAVDEPEGDLAQGETDNDSPKTDLHVRSYAERHVRSYADTGGTHELLAWLTRRRLAYSVGFSLPGDLAGIQAKLATIPDALWEPAYDADGQLRPGAWVAEVTGLFDLRSWPDGMRLIVRKERPHPGAQLRITDIDGLRITAFVTNTTKGQLADLELRHRRRARCEDRIRAAKDTGLTNLPLHDFTQNQIWCAIVALACELTAWMQTLALTGHPNTRRPDGGNPSACGCGCSPSPHEPPTPDDAACCTWPRPHRSPRSSCKPSPRSP